MKIKGKESAQVQKMRRKLKNQLEEEEKKINAEALQKMDRAIHEWIDRHAAERVSLETKTFTLFDENQHSAKTQSKFVQHLLNQLKQSEADTAQAKQLAGRISVQDSPNILK